MPHILPAAATAMAAAAPTVAATAAKATLMSTLKTVALKALTQVAVAAAMSALQPQVGTGGRTFEWVIDPDGPIPFAAGRVGVPGSVIHKDTFGPDLMYYGLPTVLSGAGPIDGIESVKADDEVVTFDGAGKAITSQYANELWFLARLGAQPDTALSSPSGLKNSAALPGWTPNHRLSGLAAFMLVMGENSKGTAYPTGEIKPLVTLRGLKVYDPRLDSTYPGGSGPHRLDDPSTWTFSANPILWALKWALGLWAGPTGKGAPQVDFQVGGIGARPAGIDFPAFVAAANVADANEWTCSAYPNTDDDKHQVLNAFLQAGGAVYAQRAGKISCIQRAAPRTSIVTVSATDTAGPLEIDTAASRIDRINTIRPRYWSEEHRWQLTAMSEVSPAAYVAEDGAKRTRGIDYTYVNNARQAGQLAALQIANTREGVAGVIPLKPHLQRIRPGDAFTITEPGFVLNGLKCLCLNTEYDARTAVVRVTFVSETDGKYPFALGLDPDPPEPQVLTPVDPRLVSPPLPGDWTITVRPPAAGGGQLPSFDLTGVVSNATATAILVEYGPTDEGPWTQAYQGPPTVTNVPIEGLQPGQTYYVAVSYQRGQNYSERYVYGPYTAPGLVAGDTVAIGGETAAEAAATIAAMREIGQGAVADAFVVLRQMQEDLAEGVFSNTRGLDRVNRFVEEVSWIEGEALGTYARRRTDEAFDGITAVVDDVSLIGARTADGTAWLLRADTVMSSPDESLASALDRMDAATETALATALSEIEAVAGDLSAEVASRTLLAATVADNQAYALSQIDLVADDVAAEITARELLAVEVADNTAAIVAETLARLDADSAQLDQIDSLSLAFDGHDASITSLISLTGDLETGLNAMVGLALNVDGHVVGAYFANTGAVGSLLFVVDEFGFVDPDGGYPIYPISYGPDNILRLQDVLIDNATILGDLIVQRRSIADFAVTTKATQWLASAVSMNGTTPTTVIQVSKATTGKRVELTFDYYADFRVGGGSFVMTERIVRYHNAIGSTPSPGSYFTIDERVTSSPPISGDDYIIGKQHIAFDDQPPAGTYTYILQVFFNQTGWTAQDASQRRATAMEIAK